MIVVLKGFSKKGAGKRRPCWNGITLLSNSLIFPRCSYYVDVSSLRAGAHVAPPWKGGLTEVDFKTRGLAAIKDKSVLEVIMMESGRLNVT